MLCDHSEYYPDLIVHRWVVVHDFPLLVVVERGYLHQHRHFQLRLDFLTLQGVLHCDNHRHFADHLKNLMNLKPKSRQTLFLQIGVKMVDINYPG